MDEHTILVAITIEAPTRAQAHKAVHDMLYASPWRRYADSLWVAEDDRVDGSDTDSAIFVPRGAQVDMRHVLNNYFDAHEQEWSEDGYPYADTDVSGAWFPGDYRNAVESGTCRHCGRHIVRTEADGWVDPQATGDDRVWRETCDSHDTFTAEHEPKEN